MINVLYKLYFFLNLLPTGIFSISVLYRYCDCYLFFQPADIHVLKNMTNLRWYYL